MAKFFLAIPTYWTHPEPGGEEDLFFDHPTPLNTPGTLRRTLDSLVPLAKSGVTVGVVAAATAPELEPWVEERVREIVTSPPLPYPVFLLTASQLAVLQDLVRRRGQASWASLLSLAGYGAIRNLTLVMATLLEAEVVVSLDDDEVIEDVDFLDRIEAALEFLSPHQPVFGVAGLYVNPDGRLVAPEPEAPWALFWPKLRLLNQTVLELLENQDPYPLTPLALGGNMVLPASLYRRLPFDPLIPRGEDVDYVVNARMWGWPFFLAKDVQVRHLPPAKPHPVWLRLRQDLLRFAYARRKLRLQEERAGMVKVRAVEFLPYPGYFLQDSLEEMAHSSHTVLALDYLAAGNPEAASQTLLNLQLLMQELGKPGNAWSAFVAFTEAWRHMQTWLADPKVATEIRRALWG